MPTDFTRTSACFRCRLQKLLDSLRRRTDLAVDQPCSPLQPGPVNYHAISWSGRASFAHFDAFARFSSSQKCPSLSVNEPQWRVPPTPNDMLSILIFSLSPAVGVELPCVDIV